MSKIGDKLKDARMAKGYTLEDLEDITNIQKRYLQAIENDNKDILPGDLYAEAFIRHYAEAVGLDGEVLVKDYWAIHGNTTSNKKDEGPVLSRASSEKAGAMETIKDSFPMILILVLILAIVIAVYIASSQLNSTSGQPMINNQNEETVFIRNSSDNEDEEETNQEKEDETEDTNEEKAKADEDDYSIQQITSEGTTTEYEVENLKTNKASFRLESVDGDSWVSIEVDGEVMDSGLIVNGEQKEVDLTQDTSEARLVLGNAPVTKVYLNDQMVELPDESDNFVRQELVFSFK